MIVKPFDRPDHTQVSNAVFDLIMPTLSGNAWKVLCVAIRQTWGWVDDSTASGRKEADYISYSQFQEKAGIPGRSTVSRAIAECVDAGYLIKHDATGVRGVIAYSLNRNYVFDTDQSQNVTSPKTGLVEAPTSPKTGLVLVPKQDSQKKGNKDSKEKESDEVEEMPACAGDAGASARTAASEKPKPKRGRVSKAEPKPQAVSAYYHVVKRWPARGTWAMIDTAVGEKPADLKFWREVITHWLAAGWKPTNVGGMLDWYKKRKLPTTGNGRNGTGRGRRIEHPASVGPAAVGMGEPWSEDDIPKVTRE